MMNLNDEKKNDDRMVWINNTGESLIKEITFFMDMYFFYCKKCDKYKGNGYSEEPKNRITNISCCNYHQESDCDEYEVVAILQKDVILYKSYPDAERFHREFSTPQR